MNRIKLTLLAVLGLVSASNAAPLLFTESWDTQNTSDGLSSRGWTDGTGDVGKGYTFKYDSGVSKNVLCINWDASDKAPKGASSLQKVISGTNNGATMHVGFKTTNFYNNSREGQTHFLRFLQNWTQPWGGMGPAPNQLNLDMGSATSPDPIYAKYGTNGANASKAFFYAGGTYASHATYIDPSPKGYLKDNTWYEIRSYMLPQKVIGQKTGKIVTDYRPYGGTWTRVITASNVELTDMSGLITKFAIGPYRQNPAVGDKLCVSFIKVYAGDAISDGTIGGGSSPTPTPIVNVKCACPSGSDVSKCVKISGTARQYTCPSTCPTRCTKK